MQVHTPAELRGMRADETFRTSPWGALVLPAILLAICIALGWALMGGAAESGEDSLRVFGLEIVLPSTVSRGILWTGWGISALSVPFTLSVNFIPTLNAATNWVLKVKGNRLYVMLRDYRNTRLPGDAPVIVSFETSEIESIGQQVRRVAGAHYETRDEEGELVVGKWKERRLEIRLSDGVPQQFKATLKALPKWSATRSMFPGWFTFRTSNCSSPVSCDDHAIRILWSGPHSGIRPRIDRALAILGRIAPIHDTSVVDHSQWEQFTDLEFEDYILELCEAGDLMGAIDLVRVRRRCCSAEAKRFIDRISGSASCGD